MKILKTVFLLFVFVPGLLFAQSAREIIRRVDNNQEFATESFSMKMIIEKGNRKLVKSFYGYGKKMGDQSFMEFTNPEDRGVKYLKIDEELWIYFPDADDIMKISGHMLRQGMMGSDISYEDMMRKEEFDATYDVKLNGSQKVRGADCYVVEMNAKVKKALYAKQVIYVDKNSYVPLKIEMYAKGGRMLKTMEQFDVTKVGNRYLARKIIIKDLRKKDSSTTVEIVKIQFNGQVPAAVFTRRYLRR